MPIVQVIIDRTTSMNIEGVYEFNRELGGTLIAPSGNLFPVFPIAGEWFWRSDLTKLYRRNNDNINWEEVSGIGITENEHEILRQLIHFVDEGPATGFNSGAYKEILPIDNPFPTSMIWYTSISKINKIVEQVFYYNTNKTIRSVVWKMYDINNNIISIIKDDMTYNGIFEISRVRTIS